MTFCLSILLRAQLSLLLLTLPVLSPGVRVAVGEDGTDAEFTMPAGVLDKSTADEIEDALDDEGVPK